MNKLKKNQIVVYAIALMLVVAGYLNYIENDRTVEISAQNQNTNIGDATLVSNNEIVENNDESDKEDIIENEDVEIDTSTSSSSENLEETVTSQQQTIETNSGAEDAICKQTSLAVTSSALSVERRTPILPP